MLRTRFRRKQRGGQVHQILMNIRRLSRRHREQEQRNPDPHAIAAAVVVGFVPAEAVDLNGLKRGGC